MTEKENNRKNHERMVIILLIIIIIFSILYCAYELMFNQREQPMFDGPAIDYTAEAIDDNTSTSNTSGTTEVAMTYSDEVTISKNKHSASILFENPTSSNQNIVLQLWLGEQKIAESKLLPIGHKLTSLDCDDIPNFDEKEYDGKFVILSYDPETNEKSIVNGEIPVKIYIEK